jgi:branched-subunit amino acid transport protein
MTAARIWATIVIGGIGTFAMRASFLVFAHRLATVPTWAQRVLRQIPPAVLAAIVLPALVRPGGQFDLWQPRLLAGVLAALVAWRTRNVGLTLVVGMAVVMAIEAL